MSWCESVLAVHINCVKGFLREARTLDLAYEPGSYSDNDRCAGTRHSYVECCNSEKIRSDPAGIIGQKTGRAPPVCEQQLVVHGKCIENFLRTSIANKTDYVFLTHSGTHKCKGTRDQFDKCMQMHKDVASGAMKHPESNANVSAKSTSKHFAVTGGGLSAS
mmetsp:Transcript_18220/g.33887  ORF Transcript_18220/g.33887 Transcript_18220/m.33887 type:complete len:162 (-) Transcript_18220:155-640(-)